MPNYKRNMRQVATYWPPAGNDGSGLVSFGSPETIACRWQNKNDRVTSPSGEEFVSKAVVYTEKQLDLGGYLFLGESLAADPKSVGHIIRQRGDSPNLRNTQTLHKVWL